MKFKNASELPLSLAVMLAHDEYPEHKEGTISVTTLLKPIKEIILTQRLKKDPSYEQEVDLLGQMNSTLGTAYHNALEAAWMSPRLPETLKALGYPPGLIACIRVNPEGPADDDYIDVFTEYRTEKAFMNWTISGEFDFLADGRLRDCKSTGTFTWVKQTNYGKYQLQLSMYRWLNPDKVTDAVGAIDFLFTDWSGLSARTQKDYPPARMMEQLIPLLSLEDTEKFIKDKLTLINTLQTAEEQDIPPCTSDDLWVEPSKYKYYRNPENAKRATKVCDTMQEALEAQRDAGGVGAIVEHKGQVKACKYCTALPICQQAARYVATGELTL